MFAQHLGFGFDFGVKGGVPFADLVQTVGAYMGISSVNRDHDYLIGPVAELRIPFGLAVEVDGLYRGAQYQLIPALTGYAPQTLGVGAWEIPYMAKFRFPMPLLKPFVSAGGVYRSFTNAPPVYVFVPTHNGVVVGGGLEFRVSKLRLSGEARWLHWSGTSVDYGDSLRLGQNQEELLFGVVF